ncbi:MAG: hypothetical protein IIB95_12790 [Candidatus Marinimicrobia bacterium]|nr:hypothetical protein [Candidatus Neomarinimicrobiota bacterium]
MRNNNETAIQSLKDIEETDRITRFDPTSESRSAFDLAIKSGRLSDDPNADNYAGSYMYMGKQDMRQDVEDWGKDMFKNIIFNSFTLQFSLIKFLLLLIEIVYIYSVFSLFTFIKQKFGFKKEI